MAASDGEPAATTLTTLTKGPDPRRNPAPGLPALLQVLLQKWAETTRKFRPTPLAGVSMVILTANKGKSGGNVEFDFVSMFSPENVDV